jgi:hypothetical protein
LGENQLQPPHHAICISEPDGPSRFETGFRTLFHQFELVAENDGPMTGEWDGVRHRQMISNLQVNAVQHGFTSIPITLNMIPDGSTVSLAFHNQGPAIPEEALGVIFDPMKRHQPTATSTPPGSFGLGLFIAHEVPRLMAVPSPLSPPVMRPFSPSSSLAPSPPVRERRSSRTAESRVCVSRL